MSWECQTKPHSNLSLTRSLFANHSIGYVSPILTNTYPYTHSTFCLVFSLRFCYSLFLCLCLFDVWAENKHTHTLSKPRRFHTETKTQPEIQTYFVFVWHTYNSRAYGCFASVKFSTWQTPLHWCYYFAGYMSNTIQSFNSKNWEIEIRNYMGSTTAERCGN